MGAKQTLFFLKEKGFYHDDNASFEETKTQSSELADPLEMWNERVF